MLLIFLIIIIGCEKNVIQIDKMTEPLISNSDINLELSNYEPEQLIRIYNSNVDFLAQAVAISLKSKQFRKQIKRDALLMIDGDYDILLKDFKK